MEHALEKCDFDDKTRKKITHISKRINFYTSVNIMFYTKWLKTEDFYTGHTHIMNDFYIFLCDTDLDKKVIPVSLFFSVNVISKYNENTFNKDFKVFHMVIIFLVQVLFSFLLLRSTS